jgi:hypothetical protein
MNVASSACNSKQNPQQAYKKPTAPARDRKNRREGKEAKAYPDAHPGGETEWPHV